MNKDTYLSDISFRNSFFNSYKLLNKRERINLKINSILSFLAGLIEIISLTIFYPLVSVIVDPKLLQTNKLINQIWSFTRSPNEIQFIIILSLIASLILVFSVLLNLISLIKSTRDASSAEERLSKELYRDLIYSPYKWHLVNNPNIIRNVFLTNINIWNKGIIRIIPAMAGQLSGIIFAFLMISFAMPKIGFILIIISGLLLSILLKFLRRKSTKLMNKVRDSQELINIFMSESLKGIKDIKLSSNEDNFIKIFYKLNHLIIKNFSSATNWNSLPSYLVIFFGQLIILVTASSFFILGIRGGELAALMAIIVLVFTRVIPLFNKLGTSFTNITNYAGYIEKINQIIGSLDKDVIDKNFCFKTYSIKNNLSWKKVKFSKVVFSYPNSQETVINDLSLEIEKGLHYAFVGSSGAGKSTLVDLFLGLLEPSKGNLYIDNLSFKEIDIRQWQKNINYVPQEPLISHLSLRENIAFGLPKDLIDDNKVYACLEQTDLLKAVKSLKQGIYTNLGNEGITLSGGQKQRVAISRALYSQPDILVLDEATSSLDTRTEMIIQKTIQNLKNKMTVISIAHRFSTIKSCDCIFVLDKGRIKDKGNFEDLKNNSKLFRKLSEAQIL